VDHGHTALTIALGLIAIMMLIGVVLLGVIVVVIFKYRVPLRGILAMFGALAYLVSPVDALPEAILGPFGLIDDVGVVTAVGIFVYRMIEAQNRRNAAGLPEQPSLGRK